MIGQHALVELRVRGCRPVLVAVETASSMRPWAMTWHTDPGGEPRVLIDPSDVLGRLDLRWVVGCLCLVHGRDAERIVAVCEALRAAGAGPVFGSVEIVRPWGVERSEVFATPASNEEESCPS